MNPHETQKNLNYFSQVPEETALGIQTVSKCSLPCTGLSHYFSENYSTELCLPTAEKERKQNKINY